MRRRAVICFGLILFTGLGLAAENMRASAFERNFGMEDGEGVITSVELEQWARNRNLRLLPDHPYRDLSDSVAMAIPEQGLDFELEAPRRGRVYLYLDFVSYQPLEGAAISRVRWLDVLINGRHAATLYQGGGQFLRQPTVIIVDREMAMDGRLRVRLRPSPGDGIFALWDAFVSGSNEGLNAADNAAAGELR